MIQNCTTYRILKVFFNYPSKKFNLKEISSICKIAHTSVKKELLDLVRKELVSKEVEKKGKRKFPLYRASLNEDFVRLKRISNEYEVFFSGIVEFIRDKLIPNSIVLFGSFSRGEDNEESDIDLFVESGIKDVDLSKFERKLKRKINLTFKNEINDLNKEFLSNVVNGIVLYGEIRLK